MKGKKMTAIEEENDVLKKAETIASLEESIKDGNDKLYISGIKYLFTKEFTKTSMSLPTRKKEKESFQYLKTYVNALDILFKKDENERHKLYLSKITSKELGIDLFNLMQNLKTFSERKKLGKFDIASLVDLKVSANYVFCNYLKNFDNTLGGALNLYFYYLGYFIESVDTFNLLLFYFLRLNDALGKFEYKEFCPDLKSSNCLNLIILFFQSVVKKPMEILTVYALLIFKYQYIFQDIDDGIEISILKKSVEETVSIVEEKTLNNKIILEYIFNEFIHNLNFNINSIYSIYSQESNEAKKEENKIEEANKDNQKEAPKNDHEEAAKNGQEESAKNDHEEAAKNDKEEEAKNDQEDEAKNDQEEAAKNDQENKFIDSNENTNNLNEEPITNQNELISQINISGIINNIDKSQINNSKKEENNKEGQPQIKENIISNVKVTDSSKTIENKNGSVNGTKDNSISSQSINGQNGNSYFDKTGDNNKSDKNENIEESQVNNTFNFENEFSKSPEIQKLIDEIDKIKKKGKEREEKAEKKFKDVEKRFKDGEKRIEHLENENNILTNEITKTKNKLDEVTKALGLIQLRDRAKNFLKSFNVTLDNKDEEAIKQKKKSKWKIISEKIKEKYKKYEKSNKYEAFIEVVKKSSETIDKGNEFAHKVKIEYYEKNIDRFVQENNIKIMNPIKICFLLHIKVSENCLLDGYELLDSFYENNMTRAFTRSKPLEKFFDEK